MARSRTLPAAPTADDEAAAEAPATRAYPVLSPLRRNGRRYEIGEPVELTDDEADELRPLGVIPRDEA